MRYELSIQPEVFEFHPEIGESEAWSGESSTTWQQEVNRSSTDYIRWLQASLNSILGLQLAVDGIMGPQTRSATRTFQQRQGLAVDGIVGPATEGAIRSSLATIAPQPTAPSYTSGPSHPSGGFPGTVPSACAGLRKPAEILDNFDFDRDQVKPFHLPTIQRIAQCVVASQRTSQPIRQILVVGHTDRVGPDPYNLGLGLRRAQQVQIQLRRAIDQIQPGLSARIAMRVDSRGEAQPIPGNAPASRRVEIFVTVPRPPRSLEQDLEDVLQYIRAQARRNAGLRRSVNPRSQFVRVLQSRYLAGYLAGPSPATAQAAIAAVGRQNTSGIVTTVCGTPDFWERATPSFNGFALPAPIRTLPGLGGLPANIGAATDILRVANRRTLSHLDVPFLLGKRTLDLLDCRTRANRGRDPDLQANNSINESQLMHWATGAKYAALGRDRLRELFFAYELWHLELWDVFGHDPLNDMIAEDAARHMADQIRSLRLNRGNLIAALNAGFIEARAWVGALLRLRQRALDRQIKADPPPSAFIHWSDEIPPTSPDHPYRAPSIRAMLAGGTPLPAVKASSLVRRYIETYTLLFEAELWEGTRGRVPLTPAMQLMAIGRLDQIFRALSAAERRPPVTLRAANLARELG